MSHQYVIGDIVRLNGTNKEGKVVGFSPRDRSLLLCDWVGDGPTKTYVPAQSVILVGPNRDAQAEHPSKIETAVESRDVTTLWDGGHKVHEPRKIET